MSGLLANGRNSGDVTDILVNLPRWHRPCHLEHLHIVPHLALVAVVDRFCRLRSLRGTLFDT